MEKQIEIRITGWGTWEEVASSLRGILSYIETDAPSVVEEYGSSESDDPTLSLKIDELVNVEDNE